MKVSLTIAVLTVLSFLLGFVRDASIAAFFGGSWRSDVLFFALTIPVFVENVLGVALRDAMIPYLQAMRGVGAEHFRYEIIRIRRFVFMGGMIVLLLLVCVPGFWMRLLAPGWDDILYSSSRDAFLLGAITIPVVMWAYLQTGVLNVKGRLVPPVWRSVLFNLGSIAAVFLWPASPEAVLMGMISGQLVHLAWMQMLMGKPDIAPPPRVSKNPSQGFLFSFLPVLGATAATQVNVLAERFFASWLDEGAISFLSYAYRLTTIPLVLFAFSIITVFFPLLVTRYLENDSEGFERMVTKLAKLALLVLIPGSIYLVAMAEPVVAVFFGRGAFDERAIEATAATTAAYGLGLSLMGLGLIGGRILMAMGRSRLVLRGALASVCATLVLDALLFQHFGTVGLALAVSCGAAVQAAVLWRDVMNATSIRIHAVDVFRWAGAGLPVALFLYVWNWNSLPGLLVAGMLTMIFFIGLIWIAGERDFMTWKAGY